jgi:LuxR family quorum sensing-dependent transcriptional regulator
VISRIHRNLALDTVEELSRLRSVRQVGSALQGAMAKFGFTSLGINGLPPPAQGADPVILVESTPAGFRETYVEERFYYVDHIGAHARTAYEPFRYSEAPYARQRTSDRRRFMQALSTFGMGRGLIVPIGRPANIPACVWLAGENPNIHDDVMWVIHLIALFAASKAHALAGPPDGPSTSNLTPREREVLRWVAQGKSAWEIGEILNISKRTVDHHTQQAARKLGAVTRAQLVVNAIRTGDIEL